jgi:hypothetical protein
MDNGQIQVIAEEFRKGILGRKKPKGMCAKVSWALQGFLSWMKVKTTVHKSQVGEWNHIYLVMKDGTIIDATADQFNTDKKKYPPVYVGKPIKKLHNGKEYSI